MQELTMISRMFILCTGVALLSASLSGRDSCSLCVEADRIAAVNLIPVSCGEESPPSSVDGIFHDIETGIRTGKTSSITMHLGKQVFLNLPGSEGAYYSANQTASLLHNFFSSRRIISFKLSSITTNGSAPFATGGGTARYKGTNELLQVYISLSKVGEEWVIAQFNVF